MSINEITLEEVEKIITSKPMQQGGIPKYMWKESYLPYIELAQKHLDSENIRIAFVLNDNNDRRKTRRQRPMDNEQSCRDFATPERMKEIANKAIDYFGEQLTGRELYECLAGTLELTDEEILAAAFITLKPYMEDAEPTYVRIDG